LAYVNIRLSNEKREAVFKNIWRNTNRICLRNYDAEQYHRRTVYWYVVLIMFDYVGVYVINALVSRLKVLNDAMFFKFEYIENL
jgi:hypothetical protein